MNMTNKNEFSPELKRFFEICDAINGVILGMRDESVEELIIPDRISYIAEGAFQGNKNLKRVVVLGKLEAVHKSAFAQCSALEKIEFRDAVSLIGSEAFSGCRALSEVDFFGSASQIQDGAFSGCTSLFAVRFNLRARGNFTEVSKFTYRGCTSLKSIYIPTTVTTVYGDGFYYNGIFFGCDSELKINMGAAFLPSGYGQYWLCRTESEKYTAIFGVTYDEYLALTADGEAA